MKGHYYNVMLWIVIITCFWWNSMCTCPSSGEKKFQSCLQNMVDEKINIKISGANGYCIGVREFYDNEESIALFQCSEQGSNVIWTFESDGTLRSDGKCLVTNENLIEGSHVMIHDCDTVARNTTIWELGSGDNGGRVIVNPTSGLVLSAISGLLPTLITLETNLFSSFQTWRVSNDTEPSSVSITGLNGLCLQLSNNNYSVWVANCEISTNLAQRWFLYQDGTIRPQRDSNLCLSYDNLINNRVVVLSCGNGPTSQRWLFTQNGTISNQRDNLVVDVKSSNPSLKEIIVYRANGGANQKWQYFPLSN